jgi:hypothetical protein
MFCCRHGLANHLPFLLAFSSLNVMCNRCRLDLFGSGGGRCGEIQFIFVPDPGRTFSFSTFDTEDSLDGIFMPENLQRSGFKVRPDVMTGLTRFTEIPDLYWSVSSVTYFV